MRYAKIKHYTLYRIATFNEKAVCYIDCYPQQKWEYYVRDDGVLLKRKGISLILPKEDFEERWKEVE